MVDSRAARRRVAVTGLGAVSGCGWGVEALWRGLSSGRAAFRELGRFDHRTHRTKLAAEVPDRPEERPTARRLSLADRFALYAADEAVEQAGLDLGAAGTVGVYFGSSTGGMLEAEAFFAAFARNRRRGRLSTLTAHPVSAPGDAVARHLGLGGPVETVSSACASGGLALGAALAALRSGEIDVALAGGADSLCQLTYAGFNALRSVDERPCRPFRADRAGMSFGEGAAVLVLEPLERALARGARPLAELAGAGASCDAHHMTAPDPTGRGAARAMREALADAGLTAAEVDFVNAHATGTPLNDAAEWLALEQILGERAATTPLVLTKSILGHLLGSSGAVEAVATVLCLLHGELHPAPDEGDATLDPALPVRLVTGRPMSLPEARVGLSTSLAFGGSNAALVFTRGEARGA